MKLLEYLKFYHIEFGVFPKFNIIVLIRLVRFPGAAGHKRTTLPHPFFRRSVLRTHMSLFHADLSLFYSVFVI